MRRCFVVAPCVLAAALAAAPAAASACRSPARVKAYKGHATSYFDPDGSGVDTGNGGMYRAQWSRHMVNVDVSLTHRKVVRNHSTGSYVIFTGRAGGGKIRVDDTFTDTGTKWTGRERYSGELGKGRPDYGSATLWFDLHKCAYQLSVSFGVRTALSGTAPWSGRRGFVSGTAYSYRKPVPRSLKLSGSANPDAYRRCPGSPFLSGRSCYAYSRGAVGLCDSLDLVATGCSASVEPVDTASFLWSLSPKFSQAKARKHPHPKKKPKKK